MLDICLLGCSGMMPMPDRWLTALLVRHNGRMILIDCGEGTQIPIKLVGWGFKAIDAICITHYHADHIAGLPGLLLTIGNCDRKEPLKIFGPPELEKVITGLTVISPELPYDLQLHELVDTKQMAMTIGDIILNSHPADHALPCLSYSIELKRSGKFDAKKARNENIPIQFWGRLQKGEIINNNGRVYFPEIVLGKDRKGLKVSYCTDSRPTDDLIHFCENSDLLICEGMYGDDDNLKKAEANKHMIFSEAAKIARNSNSSELWLTHYSPALKEPELYHHYAKDIFNNTILGKNLLVKTLNFKE